ncbi:MAG: universal stress protein [Treponema sp.]|nr:universal stress protein [Treponema sp.]
MIKPLFQNILVAVNGSQTSIHAAMYGIMMAKQYHLNMKVVYVVDTATLKQLTLSKFFVADESADYESNLTDDGEHSLKYIGDLAKQKGVKIETEMRKGAVWSEIVTAAESFEANLILIGANEEKQYGVSHHNVVSVSRSEIIASASCSVLVVRQPKIEQMFKLC